MSDAAARSRLGGSFAEGGAAYERWRPGYPEQAVAWALDGAPDGPVADVGAGTGKLTVALLRAGREVVAVEPSADMLAQLRDQLPEVAAGEGTGEATGLADGSVAAVCYGQAWHWVEPDAGAREAARVLVPGGRLALLWNVMRLDDPATAALNRAMHALESEATEHDETADRVGCGLVADGEREFRWEWRTTTAALAELVTTRSYYLARGEADRARLREIVAAAVAEHFGPLGDVAAQLPQRTVVRRFRRP